MGGREFCALLSLLRAAGPALPPGELPTLAAFSALAASFAPAPAAATGLAALMQLQDLPCCAWHLLNVRYVPGYSQIHL